jgi:hypothetical protein
MITNETCIANIYFCQGITRIMFHWLWYSHSATMKSVFGTKFCNTHCSDIDNLFSVVAVSNPKWGFEVLFGIILGKELGYHSWYSNWLDNRGVGHWVLVVSRMFTSPYGPKQLWGTPSFLFSGYQGLFPLGKMGWSMKLTTPPMWICASTPIHLHGIVLN